jgi:hypothetical protein
MVRSPLHPSRQLFLKYSFLLAVLCLISAACSTPTRSNKIIFEDPRGTVSLQTMSDRSIHATHPMSMEPDLIAQILKGMEIQDQDQGLQKLLAGRLAPMSIFSNEEVGFLAPLLAEGLRTAAPDQRVEYRIQTTHQGSLLESSTTETTAGSLYAYGRQLYVTLSQYRYVPNRMQMSTGTIRPPPPDYSGLRNRTLLFTPKAAQRSEAFDPPAGGKSTDRFLAIDYELLQHATPAAANAEQTTPIPAPSVGASTSRPSTQSTEALAQEVEALRRELQSVQQQLGNQPSKPDSPKKKATPQQK